MKNEIGNEKRQAEIIGSSISGGASSIAPRFTPSVFARI